LMSQMPSGMPTMVTSAIQARETTRPDAHHPMNNHHTNRTSRFGPLARSMTVAVATPPACCRACQVSRDSVLVPREDVRTKLHMSTVVPGPDNAPASALWPCWAP
jgi:hypothetical protein